MTSAGMPAVLDLEMYQGDDFRRELRFVDAANAALPMPGTYRAEIRPEANSTRVLATFTIDVANQAGGVIVLTLDAATTAVLPKKAVWDFERTHNGLVSTLLAGDVLVGQQVTRPPVAP